MKISLSWLNDFLPYSKTPQELDQILTDTGLEVEGFETIESIKGGLKNVVVAKVLTCEKHPNADKLKVTTVSNGTEVFQVVCGAPNVAVGQKVILAQVGSVLFPNGSEEGLKIKLSKIRDVESQGMLCAQDELGIGKSHEGIMVLNTEAIPGTPAADYLELSSDTQIEIGLTPNRADAMGHLGVARDVIAYLNCHENRTDVLEIKKSKLPQKTTSILFDVDVKDTDKCVRYLTVALSNVKVNPSPMWLQNRLRTVGISPINNIVDITNYVAREFGTPLHAFDADVVNGNIIVRKAENGETIVCLDEIERELDENDLVIANKKEAMCIAGVFGGKDSGISEKTTNVIIEAAFFQPVSVRKTAKKLTISTDASFRFERGVDIDILPLAIEKAIELIVELAEGKLASEVKDFYPTKVEKETIEFRFERCNLVLGHEIEKSKIRSILTSLDFTILKENNEKLFLKTPNYRIDVIREIDVIEEILRIYGFNLIPYPEKLNTSLVVHQKPEIERIHAQVSEVLVGLGFTEMMNNSLTKKNYYEKFGSEEFSVEKAVEMLNPLSQDLSVMRQTLIFQGLESLEYNQNRQLSNLKLFEFGKVYQKIDGKYKENKRLILLLSGNKSEESWTIKNEASTIYQLKGMLHSLFEKLGFSTLVQENKQEETTLLEESSSYTILKNNLGSLGVLDTKIQKAFGIKNEVYIVDLDWDAIIDSLKFTKTVFKDLPKTFSVRRDFSLLLDKSTRFEEIKNIATKIDKKILQNVGLFDVYEGKNLPEGKKSYAVSFTFQDAENTLKDNQIDAIMQKIRRSLETELKAELR